MSVGNVFGIVALIFAGIMLLCLGALWLEKRFPSEQFDERQLMSRGKACGLGLSVGSVYFVTALAIMVKQVDGEKWIEPYLLVFFGVMLQTMVMSTYGVLTHSYLSFQQKPIISIVGFGFCGAMQLITFSSHWREYGGLHLVGHGSFAWVPLIAGSCFLYLAAVLLVQYLFREKE